MKEDNENPVFKISVVTPYSENEILEFIALTGLSVERTETLLKRFSDNGISNLKEVNVLAKMGHLRFS